MIRATYYLGDVKAQRRMLSTHIRQHNALCENTERRHLMIDQGRALHRMYKRVAKFYGLTSKYDGKGRLRA